MVVSFVNAGLLTFTESLGVVFGANIGTTVTAWIISLLGFSGTFDIYMYLLPLIAIALPFYFSQNPTKKTSSEFVMGFVLLFLGLYFFKLNIPQIDESSSFLHSFQSYQADNIINALLFVLLGFVITSIFQSSSATIALTMVLATEGWISLDYALAMVLGENVGTTVTANIAAVVANNSAKRTALAHFLFNAIGIWWVLLFFNFFTGLIESATKTIISSTGANEASIIPIGISIFHTSFNIINTLLFTIFIRPFERLCVLLIKTENTRDEEFRLSYFSSTILSTSELSMIQANKEIAMMGKLSLTVFEMIPLILVEKNERKFQKMSNKIGGLVILITSKEAEINNYITRLSQDELSENETRHIRDMLKTITHLKSISETCLQMALTIQRKNEAKAWFSQEMRNGLDQAFNLLEESLQSTVLNLSNRTDENRFTEIAETETKIKNVFKNLKTTYLDEGKNIGIPLQTGLYFNELLGLTEKMSNFVFAINNVLSASQSNELKKPKK
jgi:phosphate:Na+ symporter